jgi:hypothetical protein
MVAVKVTESQTLAVEVDEVALSRAVTVTVGVDAVTVKVSVPVAPL